MAGYVNVILRNDFEGFEVSGDIKQPDHPGGKEKRIGMLVGAQSERAHIIFGAEYFNRGRITANTRSYAKTLRRLFQDQDGNTIVEPADGFFDNNLFTADNFDIVCYTPGQTGARGVPDFSNCGDLTPPPGFADRGDANSIFFDRFNDNPARGRSDLVANLERYSFMTSGAYDLIPESNTQFYFQAFYFDRRTFAKGTNEQIFPTVTGLIDQVDANGNVIGQVDNPFNPFPVDVIPILTLDDLPQNRDVDLQQVRLVGGFRGDLTAGWFGRHNWNYDAYGSYDRGTGFQSQPILFENNLIAALHPVQNPDGSITCAPLSAPDIFGFLSPQDCVPVNLFAPSIFSGGPNGEGVFSTQAERDFLISTRTFHTQIQQTVFNAFVSGDVMKSPWGDNITVGFGYEYRKDTIATRNSIDGVFGLDAAESPLQEGNTNGSRAFNEYFGELNVPLVVDKPFINLLQFDGSLRQTHESNFGSGTTYRVRGQYKPVSWFSISGGYGTSFRAPNLRETFLAAQGGGIGGGNDPCINQNIQQTLANFGSDSDPNVVNLINNCVADGVLFTDSDNNGFLDTTPLGTTGVTTIPTTTGGNLNLKPERSHTYTITVSANQPWFDSFDFRVSGSYYSIRIRNSVARPTAGDIISNCFQDRNFPNLTSPFCTLLGRKHGANPNSNELNKVDVTFFNIGSITARGFDFNTQLSLTPFHFGGKPVDWVFSTAVARQTQQQIQTFSASDRRENLGTIGTPKWRANFDSAFTWGNFTFATEHRMIGHQHRSNLGPNPFISRPVVFLDTSLQTRFLRRVKTVWYHDASLTYEKEDWSVTVGGRNIFDKKPPLIDAFSGPNRNNAVTSSGYDFFGRTFFATATKTF